MTIFKAGRKKRSESERFRFGKGYFDTYVHNGGGEKAWLRHDFFVAFTSGASERSDLGMTLSGPCTQHFQFWLAKCRALMRPKFSCAPTTEQAEMANRIEPLLPVERRERRCDCGPILRMAKNIGCSLVAIDFPVPGSPVSEHWNIGP